MIKFCRIEMCCFLLLLFLFGCQSNDPPQPEVTPGNCEIAVAKVFDVSGSMGVDIGSGQSLLDVLKQTAVSVVEIVPADQWNMGLGTFPTIGGPTWGMEVLTNANRHSLVNAINSLSDGGSSPMDAGLTLGALMLATDQTRPRFMVIFSDGQVCGADCSTILNTSSYLKTELGIFIITVGYNLAGDDLDTMQNVASLQSDGSPAFLNGSTEAELIDFFANALGTLCDRLEVEINTDKTVYRAGSGGSNTGTYSVRYIQGESRTVRVIPEGPFINGGGSVFLYTPTGTLSDTSPSFGNKLEVRPAAAMSGDYELTLRVVPEGGDVTLATKTVQVPVVQIEVNAIFEGNVLFNQTTNKLEGRVRVDVDTTLEVELIVNFKVTSAGSLAPATGFTYSLPPSPTFPAGSSSIPIQFTIERTGAPTGQYEVHVNINVSGLGVQTSIVSNAISVP